MGGSYVSLPLARRPARRGECNLDLMDKARISNHALTLPTTLPLHPLNVYRGGAGRHLTAGPLAFSRPSLYADWANSKLGGTLQQLANN